MMTGLTKLRKLPKKSKKLRGSKNLFILFDQVELESIDIFLKLMLFKRQVLKMIYWETLLPLIILPKYLMSIVMYLIFSS